jgi:hypothetical protein
MADLIDLGKAKEKRAQAALLKQLADFEAELQEESGRRLDATIESAVSRRLGTYSQDGHLSVVRLMLGKFAADPDGLFPDLWKLRSLPMTDEFRVYRLLKFEQILHHYLPGCLDEALATTENQKVTS